MAVTVQDIEQHMTATGAMTPLYRDWDEWHEKHRVKMVYTTTMRPNTEKGPILHRVGTQMLTAIEGSVNLKYISHDDLIAGKDSWHDVNLVGKIVMVPPMTWYELSCGSVPLTTGVVLNMPNLAWRPDYSDQVRAESWTDAKAKIV